jgi:hypothetical protein
LKNNKRVLIQIDKKIPKQTRKIIQLPHNNFLDFLKGLSELWLLLTFLYGKQDLYSLLKNVQPNPMVRSKVMLVRV